MYQLRPIEVRDNHALGILMENVLREFSAVEGKSMLGDPTLFKMFEQYQEPNSIYYVAEQDGVILGGCGVKVVPNQDDASICELQRMYLSREARGKKIGYALIQKCIEDAKAFGFKKMYLESYPQMTSAIRLYELNKFEHISHAIGNTGHSSCDIRMIRDL